ncbi:MAG TPA: hypothetical protein EYG03_28500 [Planctomycetes bacterium]|nr:hypothetical protein [Fuerstiella sp.]HIK95904.1 hypothetical protein [Planctomycetota bacterium]
MQHSDRVADQIESDDTPALQIWMNSDGLPVAGNQTTRRFVVSWDRIVFAADLAWWDEAVRTSIRDHVSWAGCFRLRRFDNAVRQFIIHGEPRFDGDGTYVGHLLAGLEVTEMTANQLDAIPVRHNGNPDVLQRQATEWHDQLVSAVTVISTSADILSTSMVAETDGSMQEVLKKMTDGCDTLRSVIRMLREASKNVPPTDK